MNVSSKVRALVAATLVFSGVFAGLATAGSHYSTTVVLWNDDANFKRVGENFTAWAQVYQNETPTNATSVTFHFGLGIPIIAPKVDYPGVYAGSPGLYRAALNITIWDTYVGVSFLDVTVVAGGEMATNSRLVITNSTTAFGGGPLGPPWSVTAGVDNVPELGRTADPGETLRWRMETRVFGTPANAPSLQAQLFIAPDVDFSETPITLTPRNVGNGAYEVSYTVPANWTVGQQLVLQATINEGNFAQANASADVWFYDTAAHFDVLNDTVIQGALTIGDGANVVPGLAVQLSLVDQTNPNNIVGTIAGNTNAQGKVSFNMANAGTLDIDVRGWINGTRSQFVAQSINLRPAYVPPLVNNSRFDAVPLEDISTVAPSGNHTIPLDFWNNGTRWGNANVVALVSNSRGVFTVSNLTTDPSGRANLTVNFSGQPFALDDLANGGMNFTFRAAVGVDASSSDGFWWGEDEEIMAPDFTLQAIESTFDTNITFATTAFAPGSPLGLGAKYTGSRDVSSFRGLATIIPGTFADFIGLQTGLESIWTGHDAPFAAYLMDGDAQEFFGTLWVPSYWPDTTYTIVAALAAHVGNVGGQAVPEGPIHWVEITPSTTLSEFTPSGDTTPPEIYGPGDFATTGGSAVVLTTKAYDNTIDFFATGNYTWDADCSDGLQTLYGDGASLSTVPGVCAVNLTVRDATGHSTTHRFNITVADIQAPIASAGADFTAKAGEVVQFNGSAVDDDPLFPAGASFNWSFDYNDTTVVLSGANASFVFWSVGTYTIRFAATDAGNNTGRDTLTLTIVPPDTSPPSVNAGADVTTNAGVPIAFNGTATDDDPAWPAGARLGWDFDYNGSAQNISGANFTFTFWALGTYSLRFFAVDAWGNRAEDELLVTIESPDKEAPVVDAGLDLSVVGGTAVRLNGSATDDDPAWPAGAQFWWTFSVPPNNYNLTGPNATFTFNQPGHFVVTLWARDAWGNLGSDSRDVHVIAPDSAPPTVQPIADATILVGGTFTFTATATDNAANFSTDGNYTWTVSGGPSTFSLYGNNATYTFAQAGDFTVSLVVRDGSGNAAPTRTFTVRVVAPDTTPPQIQASASSTTVVAGTNVTFTGTATDGGTALTDDAAFKWNFTHNGSAVVLTGRTARFTFEEPGTYNVTFTVRDAAGNAASSNLTVTVTPKPTPPPQTTPGPGIEIPLLVALLLAAAVIALALSRRKKGPTKSPEPPTEYPQPPTPPKPE